MRRKCPTIGRISRGMTRRDFDPKELRRGRKVELEHTSDWRVAERIAMDHLVEDSKYYEKLRRIERR